MDSAKYQCKQLPGWTVMRSLYHLPSWSGANTNVCSYIPENSITENYDISAGCGDAQNKKKKKKERSTHALSWSQ